MKTYKISEVAKMFDITRTALIHYDHCGLLIPSVRNEKKYRLYTRDDIKKLELIIALKESGLSIKEIQAYLMGDHDKSSIELLEDQEKKLEKKIASLKAQKYIISKRIDHLKEINALDLYDGILENDYPIIETIKEPIGYGPLMNYDSAVSRLRKRLGGEGELSSKFGICFDINHPDQSGRYKMNYVYDYLGVESKSPSSDDEILQKYIRCLHKGTYMTVSDTINRLLTYAEEHGYHVLDEALYVPLFDYWESMTDEFIGEVLIAVE